MKEVTQAPLARKEPESASVPAAGNGKSREGLRKNPELAWSLAVTSGPGTGEPVPHGWQDSVGEAQLGPGRRPSSAHQPRSSASRHCPENRHSTQTSKGGRKRQLGPRGGQGSCPLQASGPRSGCGGGWKGGGRAQAGWEGPAAGAERATRGWRLLRQQASEGRGRWGPRAGEAGAAGRGAQAACAGAGGGGGACA